MNEGLEVSHPFYFVEISSFCLTVLAQMLKQPVRLHQRVSSFGYNKAVFKKVATSALHMSLSKIAFRPCDTAFRSWD